MTSGCVEQNVRLLRLICSEMESVGISYWLDFGTLLGVVRKGGMIHGDDGIDICVTMDDSEKVMDLFDKINGDPSFEYTITQNKKHRFCGDFRGKALMLYQVQPISAHDPALLDVFFFRHGGGCKLVSMWTSSDDTLIDTIFPIKRRYVPRWGFSVNVPNRITTRLIEKYGRDFIIPQDTKHGLNNKLRRSGLVFSRCISNKFKDRGNVVVVVLVFVIVPCVMLLCSTR